MNNSKFNLYFDVDLISQKGLKVYIPEPTQMEIKGISRILGYFFKIISEQRESAVVAVTDWDRLVDESLDGLSVSLQEQSRTNLNNFFMRSLNACSIVQDDVLFDYTSEGRNKFLNDEKIVDRIKGNCLFICALLRYLEKGQMRDILTDFITSSTILELQQSLKKPAKEHSQDSKSTVKASLKTL